MYAQPQNGVAPGSAAPTLHVGTYRRALLAVIIGNDLFTEAEQLRANHHAHECQDAAKLALWTRNTLRVATERQAQREAEGFANLAQGIARFEAQLAQQQPTATQPAATPAQCDEVYRLACLLSPREKKDALRRLPQLSEAEAQAFITGLKLRRGPRLKYPVTVGRKTIVFLVPERHFEGAKVDYGRELGTGPLRPRRDMLFAGPAERRVWVN